MLMMTMEPELAIQVNEETRVSRNTQKTSLERICLLQRNPRTQEGKSSIDALEFGWKSSRSIRSSFSQNEDVTDMSVLEDNEQEIVILQ